MFNSKAFRVAIWTLLIFLIILVGHNIAFVFKPLAVILKTVFIPLLITTIFFYLTKPVIGWMESKKTPRIGAILVIYLFFATLILLAVLYLIPVLKVQFTNLAVNLPKLLLKLETYLEEFQQSSLFYQVENLDIIEKLRNIDYLSLVNKVINNISNNALSFVGSVFNAAVVAFTVPIFLFYLIRDREKFSKKAIELFPKSYRTGVLRLLTEIDQTISAYISGLLTVGLFVGVLVYIGYRIIGVDYALLLAVVAAVTNVIPYFGPVIGTVPGIILGLTYSPWVALEILVMVIIVQQVESNLVSPVVIGKKLSLHPVAIMTLLLIAGNLGGLLWMIIAVPLFAIIKIIATHLIAWKKDTRD